jgi:hypothetical protein
MTERYEIRPKKWRKKKAHKGQDWDQSDVISELEAAKRRGRVWCRGCRKFKPWQKLDCHWEWAGKKHLQAVWYCECGGAVFVRDYTVKRKKRGRKKSLPSS